MFKSDKSGSGAYVFDNGSSIRVSTSYRGGTLQRLHVSEFGKICRQFPHKAKEIVTGAFEAVGIGNQITLESTAEVYLRLLPKSAAAQGNGPHADGDRLSFPFIPVVTRVDVYDGPQGLRLKAIIAANPTTTRPCG